MRRAGRAALAPAWLALLLAAGPAAVAAQTTGAGAGAPAAAATTPPASTVPEPSVQPSPERSRPAIPYRKDDDAGDLVVKVALGLGLSLVAAFAILLALRRYVAPLQRGAGRRLRLVETLRLTPKATLYLVEVDQRTLLVGQQGETLVVLGAPDVASAPKAEDRDER
jgi:hypothetical protein